MWPILCPQPDAIHDPFNGGDYLRMIVRDPVTSSTRSDRSACNAILGSKTPLTVGTAVPALELRVRPSLKRRR